MRIVFIHFWFSFCCVVQFLFDREIIPMKWLILMNVMRRLTNDKNSDECQLSFSSFLNWWCWFWIEMSTVNYSIEKNEIMLLSFRRICLTSFVDELISFWKEDFRWASENKHLIWFHSENCSNEKNEMKFILFFWKGNSLLLLKGEWKLIDFRLENGENPVGTTGHQLVVVIILEIDNCFIQFPKLFESTNIKRDSTMRCFSLNDTFDYLKLSSRIDSFSSLFQQSSLHSIDFHFNQCSFCSNILLISIIFIVFSSIPPILCDK